MYSELQFHCDRQTNGHECNRRQDDVLPSRVIVHQTVDCTFEQWFETESEKHNRQTVFSVLQVAEEVLRVFAIKILQ